MRQRVCGRFCYDAHGDRCVCICNGRYHGVGGRQATLFALEKKMGRNRVVIGSAPKSDGAGAEPAEKKVRRKRGRVKTPRVEPVIEARTASLFAGPVFADWIEEENEK